MLTLTPQHYHQVHFITYTFDNTSHFSVENLGHEIFPHKARERVHAGPEKELISCVSVIS